MLTVTTENRRVLKSTLYRYEHHCRILQDSIFHNVPKNHALCRQLDI